MLAEYKVWNFGRKLALKIVRAYSAQFPQVNIDEIEFILMKGKASAHWMARISKIQDHIVPLLKNKRARFVLVFNCDLAKSKAEDSVDIYKKIRNLSVLHELCHISMDGRKLVKHEIEDFKSMIKIGSMSYWFNHMDELPDIFNIDDNKKARV